MKKRNITCAALLCAALVILSLGFAAGNVVAMPLDEPLLYFNDSTWPREDRAPLRLIDGVYYVPVSIFPQLSNTKVRINRELDTFVITHGELYVSFDANTGIATNCFDEYLYIKTYKLDYNENYVPAAEVCRQLGFGYQTFTGKLNGATALRITDGSEELSFRELLAKFNPAILKTVADTASESSSESKRETSVTETASNSENKPVRVLGYRTLYLTFRGSLDAVDQILELLDEYDVEATFFITYDDLTSHSDKLASIIASGHSLGILADSDAYSSEELIGYFDRTNELLYRIFKLKTRTVRLPDGSDGKAEVTEAGYNVWSYNLYSYDGYYSEFNAANSLIDGIFANNIAVMEFSSDDSATGVLKRVLEFVEANRTKCTIRACLETFTPPF